MSTPEDGGRTEHYGHAPQHGYPPQGHPGYPPPGWGPPPGYPAYRRPTNSLAVASLVLAFFFAPAGLITGIVARRQIRQTQEEGDGLALAAIIVGGIVTGLFALLIVVWVIAVVALARNGFS